MSTEIKATCPTDGEVTLRETGVLLTIMDWGTGSTYTFFCPTCKEQIIKEAPADVIALLENVVHVKRVHVPLEIQEGNRSGPPLTTDDLMEFIVELYSDSPILVPDMDVPAPRQKRAECQAVRFIPPLLG